MDLNLGTTLRQEATGAAVAVATSPTMPNAVTVFERRLAGHHRVEIVATRDQQIVMKVIEYVAISSATGYLAEVAIDLTDEEAKALGMALYSAAGGL